jgi:hypothetical protein
VNDDKIEIFECSFKWIVRVKEGGQVTERVFDIADHAHSWAAGQRIRMGIHQPESHRNGHAG